MILLLYVPCRIAAPYQKERFGIFLKLCLIQYLFVANKHLAMCFRCRHVGLFSSYRVSGNIDFIVSKIKPRLQVNRVNN